MPCHRCTSPFPLPSRPATGARRPQLATQVREPCDKAMAACGVRGRPRLSSAGARLAIPHGRAAPRMELSKWKRHRLSGITNVWDAVLGKVRLTGRGAIRARQGKARQGRANNARQSKAVSVAQRRRRARGRGERGPAVLRSAAAGRRVGSTARGTGQSLGRYDCIDVAYSHRPQSCFRLPFIPTTHMLLHCLSATLIRFPEMRTVSPRIRLDMACCLYSAASSLLIREAAVVAPLGIQQLLHLSDPSLFHRYLALPCAVG